MIEQGTEAWKIERLGHCTGSRANDLLAKIKSGEAAARKNYRVEKVVERLTGSTGEDGFVTDAMKRGTEMEPKMRAAYCDYADVLVTQLGFRRHPTIKWVGASVDAEVEAGVGGIEGKCPNTAQHIAALTNGMDSKHVAQVQWNIWVMGWQWIDFVSYDDRLPAGLQLYVQRIPRDQKFIDGVEAEAKVFLGEVEATLAALAKKVAAAK
jgi:hypothetical protein